MKIKLFILFLVLFIVIIGLNMNYGTENSSSFVAVKLENIYMIISKSEKDLPYGMLISLSTNGVEVKKGEVISFDIDVLKESMPPQAEAKNLKILDKSKRLGLKGDNNMYDLITNYAKEKISLIDVRTPEEFADGHIEGAINFPLDNIYNFEKLNIDKESIILVYCRSGNRSSQAQKILEKKGYFTIDLGGIDEYSEYVVK